MDWDAVFLSRLQFAFTISFHIIFPSFTIGLASYLAVLEALWLKTDKEVFRNLYLFWVKIFALAFGMGVVSGVVMSYQFGTNWSAFADQTGSVLGPLLSYEVLTAFFLEASFLGIMLYGWDKVGRRLHFVATACVAVGTLFSAFWIISANSWMQTPAGFEVRDGLFHAVDWVEVIFNPSFPSRLMHVVAAAYLTTGFAVVGAAGWLWLRGRDDAETQVMRRMGIGMIVLLAPLQMLIGHESGIVAEEYQPAKVAAMEGWWQTRAGQPSLLFALPDQEGERNRFEVGIPRLGSWVVAGDMDAELQGLDAFAPEDRPPVALGVLGLPRHGRARARHDRPSACGAPGSGGGADSRSRACSSRLAVAMAPAGFIAVLAGWISAEVGRQPWVVHGVLRTADAVSPVSGGQVASSLLVFMTVYAIVFSVGTLYILRLVTRGPGSGEKPMERGHQAASNPLAGVIDDTEPTRGMP